MGLKRTREELGPNPNPEIWVDVKTKEGWLRRRKRKVKPKLNEVMQQYNDANKEGQPAAVRLLDKLEPWVRGLELGRVRVTIGSRLGRSLIEKGKMDFSYLKDLDLQPRRTMRDLLHSRPRVYVRDDEVEMKVMVSDMTIKVKKSIFTDYFFELIMVWGDISKEKGLRVDSVESGLYPKDLREPGWCTLKIDVPKTKHPWMALVKVSCLEGNEMAIHPRHYALKVVAVGGG